MLNLYSHSLDIIPRAVQKTTPLTLEQEWATFFNDIYNQVQEINDKLLDSYKQSGDQNNENICHKKIKQFLELRQHNQYLVEQAIRRGDINEIGEVAFAAIAPLEGNEFLCNDMNNKLKQVKLQILALPQKIANAKRVLQNQYEINKAAAKGVERRRQIDEQGTQNSTLNKTDMNSTANSILSESVIARRDADIAKAKEVARRRTEGTPVKHIPNAPMPPPTKRIQDLCPAELAARRSIKENVSATIRSKQEEGSQRRLDIQQRLNVPSQFGDSSRSVALPPSTYETPTNMHSLKPLPIPNTNKGPSAQLLVQRSRTVQVATIPKPPPVKQLSRSEQAEIDDRNQRQSKHSEQLRLQKQQTKALSTPVPQISNADRQRIAERQPQIALDNAMLEVTNRALSSVLNAMKEHQVIVQTNPTKPESKIHANIIPS